MHARIKETNGFSVVDMLQKGLPMMSPSCRCLGLDIMQYCCDAIGYPQVVWRLRSGYFGWLKVRNTRLCRSLVGDGHP